MHMRIIDLDGSIPPQTSLLSRFRPEMVLMDGWGPLIRMGCRFGKYGQFEVDLASHLGSTTDAEAVLTLYGSGDFHHVSLALLRRQVKPFNLLVLDNHPDWMRGVPFLHCGTWLYHACRLPRVRRVFHAGGDVDFDNYYRWMAPWNALRSGQLVVFPAVRPFRRGPWSSVRNQPLRDAGQTALCPDRLEELLRPYRAELANRPLYISVDKDVLMESDAVVNWDSGHLRLAEVAIVLRGFLHAAQGNLAGMDLLGDWSPVRMRGWLRRVLHLTEHPGLVVDSANATWRNERTNVVLVETVARAVARGRRLAS